jgi:hypothetical protein
VRRPPSFSSLDPPGEFSDADGLADDEASARGVEAGIMIRAKASLESSAISVDFVQEHHVLVAMRFDDVESQTSGFEARRLASVVVDQVAKHRACSWFETKVDKDDIAVHPRRSLTSSPRSYSVAGQPSKGQNRRAGPSVNAPALPPRLSLFEQTAARSPPRLAARRSE